MDATCLYWVCLLTSVVSMASCVAALFVATALVNGADRPMIEGEE